jgi:hypothetical protein
MWFWVRSPNLDDNYRRLTGPKLKAFAEANGVFGNIVPNFKAIIGKATWVKVKGYPHMLNEIKKLDPKIKLYSYNVVRSSGLRICTNYASMMIDIAQEIITAVKEDREPNFDQFVDHPEVADFDFLEGVLKKVMPVSRLEEMRKMNEEAQKEAAEAEVEKAAKAVKETPAVKTEEVVQA